ncbi:hypothetical protein DFP72DRAFT_827157 [Ephemerocybe angulata]|uniref:Uncharacterized protein n=1 Tax=Ephemerocybe angulata TaxID=980116 RepID=A0A8H6LU04_9AGAR|nr:hypothetical protein DFP72DRAFT_827157 [Tulosesus angulatus]
MELGGIYPTPHDHDQAQWSDAIAENVEQFSELHTPELANDTFPESVSWAIANATTSDVVRLSSLAPRPGSPVIRPRYRRVESPLPLIAEEHEEVRAQAHLHHRRPPSSALAFPSEDIQHQILALATWTLDYCLSILGPVIRLLRFPLSLVLFFYIMASTTARIASTVSTALSPICHIPGMSSISGCRWAMKDVKHQEDRTIAWADYPGLVEVQSKTFEQMIDESIETSSLSLDIKKTEVATADLVALIRLSDLASRDSLATILGDLIMDAKSAGRSLHRLDAKMNGALDSIMAMNDYAYTRIEETRAQSTGKLSVVLWKSQGAIDTVVMDTFKDAMDVLSNHLERLLLETEVIYESLDRLDERLHTLRDIVGREDERATAGKEELLSYLWTKLGGNRKDLKNFDRNLKILRDLALHRRKASAHVVATIHTLRGVSEDLEDMRERVAAPNLAGSKIAPEVHMKSIRNGLERLQDRRFRARKIEEAVLRRDLEGHK